MLRHALPWSTPTQPAVRSPCSLQWDIMICTAWRAMISSSTTPNPTHPPTLPPTHLPTIPSPHLDPPTTRALSRLLPTTPPPTTLPPLHPSTAHRISIHSSPHSTFPPQFRAHGPLPLHRSRLWRNSPTPHWRPTTLHARQPSKYQPKEWVQPSHFAEMLMVFV